MSAAPPAVLVCRCTQCAHVPDEVPAQVLEDLWHAGIACYAVDDLCRLAARKDPMLAGLAAETDLTVVACQPRAVRWLFHAAEADGLNGGPHVLNMRQAGAAEIVKQLVPGGTPASRRAARPSPRPEPDSDSDGWMPWFPVIDYDRCTGCRQCLGFCLFGVYAVEDGRVVVAHPDKCKTYCPACARVCPNGAILFPKHESEAINGGENGDAGEPVQVDLSKLAGGNLHDTLRRRSRAVRNGQEPQQADEPCACSRLRELQEQLGIPDDVIRRIERESKGGSPPRADGGGT